MSRILIVDLGTGVIKSVVRPEFTAAPFVASGTEGVIVDPETSGPLVGKDDAEVVAEFKYDAATQQIVAR